MAEPRQPVESLLDLLFYAPVGLAVTAAEEIPKLIERGRGRLEGQVNTARFIGKFAVDQGGKDLGKLAGQVIETLVGFGIIPGNDAHREPHQPGPAAATTPSKPAAPSPETFPEVASPAVTGQEAVAATDAAPDETSLAIPGYGSLSASQVVQRLGGLTAEQLEAVRRFEGAGRGRKTILSRIAQLQAG